MQTLEAREERTENLIKVRQVTHYQASWTEGERGRPGMFTIQLILDNGVAEYVLRPAADDLQAYLDHCPGAADAPALRRRLQAWRALRRPRLH